MVRNKHMNNWSKILDIDVLEYGCLSYCTKCAENFYAVVNGDIVEADTPEELTKRIYKYIEENPMW